MIDEKKLLEKIGIVKGIVLNAGKITTDHALELIDEIIDSNRRFNE